MVGPQRGLVARQVLQGVALGVDADGIGRVARHFALAVAIGGDHAPAAAQFRLAFQLQASHARFARLHAEGGVGRIGGDHVLLRQLEHGQGDQRFLAGRLVLDARFVLLALGRLERRAGAGRADGGVERR